MNAYVIAMDTAAAALAALAAGLIIARRRGPRAPFPGLTGSLRAGSKLIRVGSI